MRFKEKEKLQKKNAIVRVAAKLFSEYGFEAVTISSIAKRVGVAKGTIYTYFENKYELFIEVLKFAQEVNAKRVKRFLEENENLTAFEKILGILEIFKDFIETYPEYVSIFMILSNQLPNEVREKIIKVLEEQGYKEKHVWELIASIIEEGKKKEDVGKGVDSRKGGIKIWFFYIAVVVMLNILDTQAFSKIIDDDTKKEIRSIILEFLSLQIKRILEE